MSVKPRSTAWRCAVALALLAAACQPSRVSSEATVTISGRLIRQGGDPVAGTKAVITPDVPGFGDLIGGTFLTLISLGLVCLDDSPPSLCRLFNERSSSAQTSADGSYSIDLKGSETRTFFGNARPMSLTSRLPGGNVVQAVFRVQTEELQLPELRFWEPAVRDERGVLTWDAVPADGFGDGKGYQVLFEDEAGRTVWSSAAGATRLELDKRVLEDTKGTQTVVARREDVAPGSTLDLAFRAAPLGYSGSPGAPPSRGKPCSLSPGGELKPCPATDGDLFTTIKLPAEASAPASPASPVERTLTVDLGAPRAISLAVVRGCSCTLAVSSNGSTFEELGRGDGDWLKPAPRGTNARYVRLSGSVESLRELSVW